MFYGKYIKRFFDFTIASLLIILTFPIMLIIIVLLFFTNNGKIFYFQPRPGIGEKIFLIIKFRTMNDRKDSLGNLLPDEQRLTWNGEFIRRFSLDEIPQLINVIIGNMSLVGPRPLLQEYIPLYNNHQTRRHEVKPGITGWAQVNGRNAISWQKKFELDVWYVDNLSFLLDVKIIMKTIIKVVKRDGINSSTSIPMEKFTGN